MPNHAITPRRAFSPEYKLRVLNEAAKCVRRGELEALLRREGLRTSHLSKWRAIAQHASLEALRTKPPGPRRSDPPPPRPRPGRPMEPGVDIDVLRRIVLLQGRILRRLLPTSELYGLEDDLAELRAAAEPAGLGDLIGPRAKPVRS